MIPIEALVLYLINGANNLLFNANDGINGDKFITFDLNNRHVVNIYVKQSWIDLGLLKIFSRLHTLIIMGFVKDFTGIENLSNFLHKMRFTIF